MAKNNKTLIREAKRKLAKIGKMFEGRDSCTHHQALVYEEDGKVTAALKLWTGGHPFNTEVDTQLVEANLSLFGGFTDVTRSLSDGNKELTYYSTYTGEEPVKLRYGETTLAALVKFVQKHKSDFPHGLNTKIALGDFEGNNYHRKVAVSSDDGRLFLNYEMNEYDDAEEKQ